MNKYLWFFLMFLSYCVSFPAHSRAEDVFTWSDCVKEASQNHPDLISAEESINQSRADKKITLSEFLPQIDSDLAVLRSKTSTTTVGNTTSRRTDTYNYGVSGTQLFFDGFKTYNDMKSDSENIKAAGYNYKFTSSEIRLRLRTAFIDLLKAQQLLKITREIYDIRKGNFELITLLYESGREHRGALLNAEANLIKAGTEVSQAERTIETAQRELTKELGRKEFSPICVNGEFQPADRVLEKPDFKLLAENNPYLRKYAAQKNAAAFDIKSAEADFYPRISGSADAERRSAFWPPRNHQWSAGVSVSFPLFEGGSRLAELYKAKSLFSQAVADERSARDSVILALEQYWALFQDTIENVEVQKKFLEAAIERSRIAEAQYSIGTINFDNWIIIEDDLVSTKKSFLNAQADVLYAEADWIQAKGETLEYAQ